MACDLSQLGRSRLIKSHALIVPDAATSALVIRSACGRAPAVAPDEAQATSVAMVANRDNAKTRFTGPPESARAVERKKQRYMVAYRYRRTGATEQTLLLLAGRTNTLMTGG